MAKKPTTGKLEAFPLDGIEAGRALSSREGLAAVRRKILREHRLKALEQGRDEAEHLDLDEENEDSAFDELPPYLQERLRLFTDVILHKLGENVARGLDIDEISRLYKDGFAKGSEQDFVKSIPDTLVSLQSVAAVLVGTLDRDEAFVRNLVNTIADEEREKQEREAVPPLPTVAPRRWADRPDKSNKNPAPFIQDVYGKWFGHGFHEGKLRDIDNALFKAWEKWMAEGAKDAPAGFRVPTASEWEQQNRLPPEIMKRAVAQLRRDQRERDRTRGR